jgi:hypothetical protein
LCCWELGGLAFAAESSEKGMVALCCMWISVYSATLNSRGYTFVGDISTQRLKSKTSAISLGVYPCLSLIMAYICPYMLSDLVMAYICPYMLSDLEWGLGLMTSKYFTRCEVHQLMEGLFFGAGCTLAFVVILSFAPEVILLCIKADTSRRRDEH